MSLSFANAGINITSEKLQIVEVSCKDEKFIVENIEEEFFGEILDFSNKEAKLINILQSAFDEINLRSPIKAKDISFTLPPNKFRVFEIPFELSLAKKDLLRHIKWEFNMLFPHEDENSYIIREVKIVNNNLRLAPTLIILAVRKSYLTLLHKFCLRNKLNLKLVDHAHLAATNVFRGFSAKSEELSFSLYLSDKSFSLVLLDKDYPIYFKNFTIDSAVQILDKLKKALNVINEIGIPMPAEKRGYIAGDNISDALLGQIKDELNLTFIKLNPFALVKTKSELEETEFFNRKYNSFAAPVGISFRLS